jgi:hypothetical protein
MKGMTQMPVYGLLVKNDNVYAESHSTVSLKAECSRISKCGICVRGTLLDPISGLKHFIPCSV